MESKKIGFADRNAILADPEFIDVNVSIHPSSFIELQLDCIVPENDFAFPGQQKLFMDFILLQGKSGKIDYSMILPEVKNLGFSYDLYLNIRRQPLMKIRQLQNKDCFFTCDGMTNKREFCWLIFEVSSTIGKPKLFNNELLEFNTKTKLEAFRM